MVLKARFRGHSRKESTASAAFGKEQRGGHKSRKKSSASAAFGKGGGDHQSAGAGKFRDMNFLKRVLGKGGTDVGKSNSGQVELELMAQLSDIDAIQLLAENGMDAKDHLGLSSLFALALTGDMDAWRLLANRGMGVGTPPPKMPMIIPH